MPYLRALLSLVTLFGGHFLNRRLDRVVLIGTLLVLTLATYMSTPYAMLWAPDVNLLYVILAPRALLLLIAIVSAWLTFKDARHATATPLNWTMRITGALLCVAGVLAYVESVFFATAFDLSALADTTAAEVVAAPASYFRTFHAYAHFGGTASTHDLPAPPSGPERLRGRITLDGRGVSGVQLYVVLNSKYKADKLRTDADGIFEIELPAGTWHLNHISLMAWEQAPEDRQLVLISGREPLRGSGQYHTHGWGPPGLEVKLPLAPEAFALEMTLRDEVALTWPPDTSPGGQYSEDPTATEADFATASIGWQPVEGATLYEVQISHVERKKNSASYSPVLMRRVSGTSLTLNSLPKRSATTASRPDEYAVQVFAFDAQRRLVTSSKFDFDRQLFTLAGMHRLGREEQFAESTPEAPPKVISEEYEVNELRLSLVAKLLDRKAFDEARTTLAKVTADAPPGRATALRGRLAALQGDCVTATKLFDQADLEGGAGCSPLEDRRLCMVPQN
jgi:hypothetical protein